MEKFYTCEEVATRLKVKVQTVWGWIRTGRLSAVRIGKVYRVSEESLSVFLSGENAIDNHESDV